MTDQEKAIILSALDLLAVALTDHVHQWTEEQRASYEQSILILRGGE